MSTPDRQAITALRALNEKTRSEQMNARGVRYEAEWISAQFEDANGEWDPDRDEYSVTHHATLDEAKGAAIAASKAANVVEWVRVTEQEREPHPDLPGRKWWCEKRTWTGDWDGNWNEPDYVDNE